jgi:hypothetical protein
MGTKPLERVEEPDLWRVRGLAVFGLGVALYSVEGKPGVVPSALQPVEQFAIHNPGILVLATVQLFVLNYRLFGSVLRSTTRVEGNAARWLRAGQLALSGIPLLGPYLLSLWRWTVGKNPFWFLVTHGQCQTPPLYFLDGRLALNLIVNLLVFQGWIAYLSQNFRGHLFSHILCSLAVASSQMDVLVSYHRALISRRRGIFLALLSFLWIGSWPFWVLGWIGHILLINTALCPQHRMKRFFKGRLGLHERLEESQRLDWWKASRWRSWRPSSGTENSAADLKLGEKLLPVCRFKVLLTVFEAAGAMILLAHAGQRFPVVASYTPHALLVTVVSSLIIAAIGFIVLICDFLVRFFRMPLLSEQTHDGIKYLALSQASMLVGIYNGMYFVQLDLRRLGFLLTAVGGLVTFAKCLLALSSILPSREAVKKKDGQFSFWTTLFALTAIAGVAIRTSETLAFAFKLLMLLLMAVTPVFVLGAGLTLVGRFRPFLPTKPSPALRGAFAFCMVTAFLPLGGLAVPLWILTWRRMSAIISSPPSLPNTRIPSMGEQVEDFLYAGLKTRSWTRESRHYFFANVVSHLAAAGERQKTYELFERTRFLPEQLAHFGGFGTSSDDLETYVVPMAIAEPDWNRFIYFMMLALHLRGAVEDLPELIEPLARSGQVSMALDAVSRIASPLDRAGAKAMIARELSPDLNTYQELLQSLPHDLAALPAMTTDPTQAGPMREKQYWISVVIAQSFGLGAREPLTRFLADCPAWWSDIVWIHMAFRHAEQHHNLLDSELWEALSNVQDSTLLKEFLPELLAASEASPDPEPLLAQIKALCDDPELSWLCRFTLLDGIARTSAEQAISLWWHWDCEKPVSWSLQVAERAAPFLNRLHSHEIADLIDNMGEPEVKAALLLALCSSEGGLQWIEGTRSTIENVPPGARRVHWLTHFLKIWAPLLNRPETRDELIGLAQSLHELSYEVETADLCCFFELIATHFPERLKQEMMGAFWAPNVSAESLLEIVETTESAEVLEHLLERVDQYLLPFRPGEAEAFQAWGGLLEKIVPRLCVLTRDFACLERAVALNPQLADELRTMTVKALVNAKSPDLAKQVWSSIRQPRLRHLTRLKHLAAPDPEIFHPVSLLGAFADSEMVQDVVFGLQALASVSGDACHQLHAHIGRIEDQQEKFLVLLRMVDRALAISKKQDRQDDLLDTLVQSASLVTADVQFAALAPEITAIVARHSKRQSVTEVREALERLLALRSVPWPVRRDLCEALLSRVLPLLAARAENGSWETAEIVQMITGPLEWIEYGADEEIEERGILPVLFAVMDRLPLRVLKRFVRDLPSEGLFPALYVAGDGELGGVLDRMAEEDHFDPLIVETILYLLSYRLPGVVPDILRDLNPGPFRELVAVSLLRNGWLPAELAPEVLPLIENQASYMSTEITLALACAADSEEEDRWLQTLASIMPHQLVDPSDPRNEPWLRKLWTVDPGRSRPILAWGVLRTLAQAGRWHGTSAFCLWLNAHLAPETGKKPAELLALCAEAAQAVQKSLKLTAIPTSTNI